MLVKLKRHRHFKQFYPNSFFPFTYTYLLYSSLAPIHHFQGKPNHISSQINPGSSVRSPFSVWSLGKKWNQRNLRGHERETWNDFITLDETIHTRTRGTPDSEAITSENFLLTNTRLFYSPFL